MNRVENSRRSNGFESTVIYTFGQKAVPANDIIMKFMAAACITRQMIYAQRLVAGKQVYKMLESY